MLDRPHSAPLVEAGRRERPHVGGVDMNVRIDHRGDASSLMGARWNLMVNDSVRHIRQLGEAL